MLFEDRADRIGGSGLGVNHHAPFLAPPPFLFLLPPPSPVLAFPPLYCLCFPPLLFLFPLPSPVHAFPEASAGHVGGIACVNQGTANIVWGHQTKSLLADKARHCKAGKPAILRSTTGKFHIHFNLQ